MHENRKDPHSPWNPPSILRGDPKVILHALGAQLCCILISYADQLVCSERSPPLILSRTLNRSDSHLFVIHVNNNNNSSRDPRLPSRGRLVVLLGSRAWSNHAGSLIMIYGMVLYAVRVTRTVTKEIDRLCWCKSAAGRIRLLLGQEEYQGWVPLENHAYWF